VNIYVIYYNKYKSIIKKSINKRARTKKASFISVGIKGSHVWSHDQGDRPNHVTNLP
jgi:hypothetical protein